MNIRDRVKELRRVPASQLQPNPKNWRTHPESQQNALRGILAEVGIAGAVLAYETPEGGLMLVDGHLRAETLHNTEVPVLVLDITPEEADKLLATIDPLAAMAEADAEKLRELLESVETASSELADMFTALAEDAGILDGLNEQEITEDEVPEPPADPITKPGDLWILGDHRLLCGDSTKPGDVERLMAGAKADLVFTDPPYNCADEMNESFYANANSPAMKGLAAASWDKGFDVSAFLSTLKLHCPKDGSVYVCTSHMLAPEIWQWMKQQNSSHHSYIVWCKPNPMPSLAKRHPTWATELICYATFGKHTFNFPTTGHALSWWEISKNSANKDHPTQKPVEVPAKAISLSSNAGNLVLDPFLGSGTTLIAAEQLGRKCYGMEISPQYCDVIVRRWETLTGRQATREEAAP